MNKYVIFALMSCILYALNNENPQSKLSDTFKSPKSKWSNSNYSNLRKDNTISANLLQSNEKNSFWIEINCNNIDEIAGFQFELPKNLILLDAEGVRSKEKNFQLHKNDNGLILGFSMSGDTIGALESNNNTNMSLIKIHVKLNDNKIKSYPIKTILAGPKGQKLTFSSFENNISLNGNDMQITFYE